MAKGISYTTTTTTTTTTTYSGPKAMREHLAHVEEMKKLSTSYHSDDSDSDSDSDCGCDSDSDSDSDSGWDSCDSEVSDYEEYMAAEDEEEDYSDEE